MNQPEFLMELRDLLSKHKVAICTPGINITDSAGTRKIYSHIEFIYEGAGERREVMSTPRMHVTAHDVRGMLMQLKLEEPL